MTRTQWDRSASPAATPRTRGLRVVDASVMPVISSANTNGPTYAIAARAADLIKRA